MDALAGRMKQGMATRRAVDPFMTLGQLHRILRGRYAWALAVDRSSADSRAHFWYRSEENGENRPGERDVDAGVENETFVDVVGAVQALDRLLERADPAGAVADFLMHEPACCHVVSRVQLAAAFPYTEIRGTITSERSRAQAG